MDQRIGVHHFNGCGKFHGIVGCSAQNAVEVEHQQCPDALAAAQDRIAHGFQHMVVIAALCADIPVQCLLHHFNIHRLK